MKAQYRDSESKDATNPQAYKEASGKAFSQN